MNKKNNIVDNDYYDEDFDIRDGKKNIIERIIIVLGKLFVIACFILLIDFVYTLLFSDKPLLTIEKDGNKYSSILYDVYNCESGKTIKFKTEKYSCYVEDDSYVDDKIDYSDNDNKIDNGDKDNVDNDGKTDNNDKIDNSNKVDTDNNIDNSNKIDTDNKLDNSNKIDTDNKIDNIEQSKIILIKDTSNNSSCADAIEYYYEDANYKYYFTCIKSHSVFVYVNGIKYNIKDALNNNVVTMDELVNAGFSPLKDSKNLQTR